MTDGARIPVLVITGPVGVGKTTIAQAVSELLEAAALAHAVVDLDWLRWSYPRPAGDPFHTALGLRNLALVWQQYRTAGAERLIIVDIVETRAMIAAYAAAVPGAEIITVRLDAAVATIQARLAGRERGASLLWHQRRAAELLAHWARSPVEDLRIDTEGQAVLDIAREVLARTRWADVPAQPSRDDPAAPAPKQ